MSFGGFLGMGESYHPLPWDVLHYDERQGGYVVDLNKERLQNAPYYGANDMPDWSVGSMAGRSTTTMAFPGVAFDNPAREPPRVQAAASRGPSYDKQSDPKSARS
jgi:hypothetical protein